MVLICWITPDVYPKYVFNQVKEETLEAINEWFRDYISCFLLMSKVKRVKFLSFWSQCCSDRKCLCALTYVSHTRTNARSLQLLNHPYTHIHKHTLTWQFTPLSCHTHTFSLPLFISQLKFSLPNFLTSGFNNSRIVYVHDNLLYCHWLLINTQLSAAVGQESRAERPFALCLSWVVNRYISGCRWSVDAVTTDCETVDLQQVFFGSPVLQFRGPLCLALLFFGERRCRLFRFRRWSWRAAS